MHCFRCKQQCTQRLAENEIEIFDRLRSFDTKNEQDVFLQSLISSQDVKKHRPRKQGEAARTPHEKSFNYYVMVGDYREQVCVKAFQSLFGIKISRIRRLRNLLLLGKSPKDLRGKQTSSNTIPGQVRLAIREHINSFPVKESKYAGKVIKYLDSRLTLKTMFQMFKEKHPDMKCGYSFFCKFFNENYALKFGRPQIDSCPTCEELTVKLKSPHLSEAAKRVAAAEKIVHERKAQKFYRKLKSESDNATANSQKHVLAIAFDYMQNVSLPMIPVQDTFYLRQLTVNVFCIHDIKKNQSLIHVYHEGQARKCPDEVCSFVYDYLSSVPSDIEEVHVYSDNCSGQNKNHSLNRLFLALTDTKKFKKIEQFYPVRGHSFLPCDRDFSIIKRSLRKHDRLYSVHQLTEIIISSSQSQKFSVVEVDAADILDFKTWWKEFYKKTCVSEETRGNKVPKAQKVHFGISSIMHFTYSQVTPGTITARHFIDGLTVQTFKLSHLQEPKPTFPSKKAYPAGKIPLKVQKVNDIRQLMPYIPPEFEEFYNEILHWDTGDISDGENELVDDNNT